jgi:hypothetical protein
MYVYHDIMVDIRRTKRTCSQRNTNFPFRCLRNNHKEAINGLDAGRNIIELQIVSHHLALAIGSDGLTDHPLHNRRVVNSVTSPHNLRVVNSVTSLHNRRVVNNVTSPHNRRVVNSVTSFGSSFYWIQWSH